MHLPCFSLSSIVDDILQIFVKRLFCRGNLSRWFVILCWLAFSLHLRLLIVSHWVYNLMQTDAIPYSLFGFVACISREKNYFVHNHKLTKIFENSKVITRWSAVTRSELGNKMCLLTRSIQARKDKNVYSSLQIVRPPSQRTLLSKFVIWIGLWLVHSVTDHTSITLSHFSKIYCT